MLSSTLDDSCTVTRNDIKNYFLHLLTTYNILHFKIDEQLKLITDANVQTLISNVNKHYKISFAKSYEQNEEMGKNIFLDILYCNFHTMDIDTSFPQINKFPYLTLAMADNDCYIKLSEYKKKILKYYNDYIVPVTFDGKTVNINYPDSKG